MMRREVLESFEIWLRTQTGLSEGSIHTYLAAVRQMLSLNGANPDIVQINEYVSMAGKEKNAQFARYAVAKWLEFTGRSELKVQLVKLKQNPRKRYGTYLTHEQLAGIIARIPGEKYQLLAELQYATGRRAREIIGLRTEMVEIDGKLLKLRLIGKGKKEITVWVSRERFAPLLTKFVRGKFGYFFLGQGAEGASEMALEGMVRQQVKYYWHAVKHGARAAGFPAFATHDFRRNFAQAIWNLSGHDLEQVRRTLGHASMNTTARYVSSTEGQSKDLMVRHQELLEGGV